MAGESGKGQSLGRVFGGVLAGMFGVRSGRARRQDFTRDSGIGIRDSGY